MKIIHAIRDAINKGIVELVYIASEYNVADIMTKIIAKKDFARLQE